METQRSVRFAVQGGVTETRVLAAEICADLRRGEILDSSFERRAAPLDSRDRRWLQELTYGMLRRRSRLDAILTPRVRGGLARLDPDLVDLLRVGVDQLLFMGSVPPYAAIAQTVELAKRRHGIGASKLANAVLRRIDREREDLSPASPSDPIAALALEYSHPAWLVSRWLERYGPDETIALLESNNTEPPMIARPYGIVREQLEASLEAAGVRVGDAPLVRDSVELLGSVALADLGAYKQGLFFIQDPASTLVSKYAAIPAGATVADLCAAPGGKSLEMTRVAGSVIASDRSYSRLQRVISNIRRLDARGVLAFVGDARHPAIKPVDVVLIDVPCTGTGTFRRHPDARWRLKPSDVAVMGALQQAIFRSAAGGVAPGGLLIYSTCSIEPEENDEQVAQFLEEHSEFTLEPPAPGELPAEVLDAGFLRVLPQRHGTDGAFAARLRRSR